MDVDLVSFFVIGIGIGSRGNARVNDIFDHGSRTALIDREVGIKQFSYPQGVFCRVFYFLIAFDGADGDQVDLFS